MKDQWMLYCQLLLKLNLDCSGKAPSQRTQSNKCYSVSTQVFTSSFTSVQKAHIEKLRALIVEGTNIPLPQPCYSRVTAVLQLCYMPAEICFSALNNCTLNQSWGLLLKTATIYYKSSTVKRWRFLFSLQFFSGISLSKADSYYNSLFCVIDNPDYWAGVAQTNLYYGQLCSRIPIAQPVEKIAL